METDASAGRDPERLPWYARALECCAMTRSGSVEPNDAILPMAMVMINIVPVSIASGWLRIFMLLSISAGLLMTVGTVGLLIWKRRANR